MFVEPVHLRRKVSSSETSMPFPSTTGILLPEDFEIIHRVFSDIAVEPWFTQSNERRDHFAAEIVDAYRQGMADPRVLADHCWAIARQHYGNGGTS